MLFGHKHDKRALVFRIAVIVVIIAVAAAIAVVRIKSKPVSTAPDARATLAQCLTDKGVKMYGAYWCPHCQQQKKDFGSEAFKKVTYVECAIPGQPNDQTPACKDADIKGYPTWVFPSGDRATGEQPFKDLAEKSGCTYTEAK